MASPILWRFISSIQYFTQARIQFRNMSSNTGPVESAIDLQLKQTFNPTHLQIINESYMHNVPKGSETHFKVVVVSDSFDGKNLVSRHRMVNDCLKSQLESGVHALSIVAKTPDQWKGSNNVDPSPACRGGFGK